MLTFSESARLRRGLLGLVSLLAVLSLPFVAGAQAKYLKPPPEILEILNAPALPQVLLSPTRDRLLIVEGQRYPSISELAGPMVKLAGLRVDPLNNGPFRATRYTGLVLRTVATGKEMRIVLPPGAQIGLPVWSADGKRFAFQRFTAHELELWAGEAATGQVKHLKNAMLNAATGEAFIWMPNSQDLLCRLVSAKRGTAPTASRVPRGPQVQESTNVAAPTRTYQDLLETPHDEALLDYYATAQLAMVDTRSGRIDPIGTPSIFTLTDVSPDGRLILVERRLRPYSYQVPLAGFPRSAEVWNLEGHTVQTIGNLPATDSVPLGGVPRGPRQYHWLPTESSTLVWVEALDNGDPRVKSPVRDRILMHHIPFDGEPRELIRTENRFSALFWGETPGLAILRDFQGGKRWSRTFLLRVGATNVTSELLWERSADDRYNDPGSPLLKLLPNNQRVLRISKDAIFLAGSGISAEGVHPFLDRFDLTTHQTDRLFQCDDQSYETIIGLATDDGSRFITRRETPSEPPNYWLHGLHDPEPQALTHFADPTPQVRKINRQVLTCEREDGVQITCNVYLPPDYQPGQRLPTVLWSYPREFSDADNASQTVSATNRFTSISGVSDLFFALEGYAVIDASSLPIVGVSRKRNDTFVEQIVMDAQAIVNKAAEMGITDPERVGVDGHSYGAFMAANLLAHSDIFRAGIARSGAYNRTLTPFGFQNETRTLWEAPDTYLRMSPFLAADHINEPLLLIHGDADNNPGTFPMQSERLFQAIKGVGGQSRLVMLPFESHVYEARESIEDTMAEMVAWFDKYVKNAAPRRTESTTKDPNH